MENEILRRYAKIVLAKKSFWDFCQTLSPEYYKDSRTHLKVLCNTLEKLYTGKLLRPDGTPFKKIIINYPPQHGKTRTLINFCMWVFGNNNEERIIACSYNDDTASDFSRYTRDGIQQDKFDDNEIVFSDIFPGTKIKHGHGSYQKWALDGQHFNYLGAGVGGSITSKGATILMIDDPVKGAIEALNETHLDKLWQWYTGTFLSRVSAGDGEPVEIVNMTRWAKKDIAGRLLSGEYKDDWYVLKREVYDKENDKMLCSDFLSKERYLYLRSNMPDEIFMPNYHQVTIDLKGCLYKKLKIYEKLPRDNSGNLLFEMIKNYTDTADEGDNYLCSINYGVYEGEAYILDVYYTRAGMEVTEPGTAKFLVDGNVNVAKIESNNGGRGFARSVKRIIHDELHTTKVIVKWFHQSQNKMARIITNSAFVQEHIYFPVNWKDKWPEFYEHVTSFQKEGKNKYDDAEDALTGVVENTNKQAIGFLR